MHHTSSRTRWIPLAVTALLFGLVTLVAPSTAGAQDTATYTVEIMGNCPATIDDVFSYTVVVTNSGASPIEVVALDQTFTVAAGATESVKSPGEVLGELEGSIRIDGEAPEGISVALPGCVAPPGGYTIAYTTACPGETGPGVVTVTSTSAKSFEVTAGDLTFTVESGATVTKAVPLGLTAFDFDIDGGGLPSGQFTNGAFYIGPGSCADAPSSGDDPPSSGDEPPSSSDDPPSVDDDAVPISAPLSPKFTG